MAALLSRNLSPCNYSKRVIRVGQYSPIELPQLHWIHSHNLWYRVEWFTILVRWNNWITVIYDGRLRSIEIWGSSKPLLNMYFYQQVLNSNCKYFFNLHNEHFTLHAWIHLLARQNGSISSLYLNWRYSLIEFWTNQ